MSRWQGVKLYNVNQKWDPANCQRVPQTCELLRGRLRSERPTIIHELNEKVASVIEFNVEEVVIFSLSGRSHVPPHVGSPLRVNVHLCLLHCEESYLEVGGGPSLGGARVSYQQGELLAFDDAVMHGIENLGQEARVILTIGVLHPELSKEHRACTEGDVVSPQQSLDAQVGELGRILQASPPPDAKTLMQAQALLTERGQAGDLELGSASEILTWLGGSSSPPDRETIAQLHALLGGGRARRRAAAQRVAAELQAALRTAKE